LRRAFLGFASAWLVLLPAAGGRAQSTPPGSGVVTAGAPGEITADEFEYQGDRDVYVGRGHVRMVQGDRSLEADRVIFSNTTGVGVASGNVVIKQGPDTLHSEFVEFDVHDLLGVVFQGRLASTDSQYRMTGEEVRKIGDETYTFENGRFTTCNCPEPGRDPWTLTAEKAKLDLDGVAKARNATIEILDVPVFWAPWIIYPLKKERQTGFLLPSVGRSSRNGFAGSVPFFWAAADELSVLLTPEYLADRGFKPAVDLEYLFGERSRGDAYGTFIHDIGIDANSIPTPYGDNRWGAIWSHVQELPAGIQAQGEVAAVSDNDFAFDFDDFKRWRTNRFIESSFFAGRPLGPADAFPTDVGVLWAQDVQTVNNDDRDNVLLQRLPQVESSAVTGPVPVLRGLMAGADLEYAYFRPRDDQESVYDASLLVNNQFFDTGIDNVANFDAGGRGEQNPTTGQFQPGDAHADDFATTGGPERDGLFEEGEPLADRGNRVFFNPHFAYPMRLGDLVEFYPEVGYSGTFYDSALAGFAQRSLVTGRVDLRARLRGDVAFPFGLGNAVHFIEPFVGWAYVNGTNQDSNPVFVPATALPQERLRLLDLDNVTRDQADRIPETNELVMGLSNRFLTESGRLAGELAVWGAYRFSESEIGPVVLEGSVWPSGGFLLRGFATFDAQNTAFDDALFEFGWHAQAGHQLGLRYRFLRNIPQFFENYLYSDRFDRFTSNFNRINQISGSGRWQVTPHWALLYDGSFSFENTFSLRNAGGIEYLSRCKCWAARLEVANSRSRGSQVNFKYTVVGFGDKTNQPFGAGSIVDVLGGL
jgi:lipopolysaccharide assembly outer membrane protein LptD (OstA)